jgi:hypothetical protein
LDVADDAGRSTPDRGELAHLRFSGLRARLGMIGRILPSGVRDRVSSIALGTGFAISLWAIVFSITGTASVYLNSESWMTGRAVTFGPFTSLGIILYSLWVLAFVAALIGWARVTRWLLVGTIVAGVVARVGSDLLGMNVYPQSTLVILLAMFALFALTGTPQPTRRSRAWLAIAGAVGVGWMSCILWQLHDFPNVRQWPFYERGMFNGLAEWMGWLIAFFIVATIGCLLLAQWRRAGVLAISSVPWVALYFAGQVAGNRISGDSLFAVAIIALLVAAGAALVLTLAGFRVRVTRE